ncbi:MAG TPA: RDD family protein, partial [Verrucomicrobiae bacterium]|nr:RDD family protein [Verrucomicrobiae bacterium]
MEPSFKIIGGDGREYGPAGLEEIRAWVREGRVAATTMLWRSDCGAWAPAGTYEELRADFPLSTADRSAGATQQGIPVGFLARLGAYIVDFFILYVSLAFLFLPWHAEMEAVSKAFQQHPFNPTEEEMVKASVLFLIMVGIYSLLSAGYFILMHGLRGATVGKMLFRARVVNLDGSPIDVGRATVRYMGELASWSIFGIGYLMIAFREDKRGL